VYRPGIHDRNNLSEIAEMVRITAPDIDVRLINANVPGTDNIDWLRHKPSLLFTWSHAVFQPPRGYLLAAKLIGKLDEYAQLVAAGIPVPFTRPLRPNLDAASDLFGEYASAKPLDGYLGRGVRLVKTTDMRGRFAEITLNGHLAMIAQRFIECEMEDGKPVEYRVNLVLGEPFCMMRRSWRVARPPLDAIARNPRGLIATSDPRVAGPWMPWVDDEIVELARAASRPFAPYPGLGVDIIRERSTGKLFVLEVDSRGFDVTEVPRRGASIEDRAPYHTQFDGLAGIAKRLVDRTRDLAV
jgi:glutathione synthase/RimK-type ligase-like ATP-grasp enzyme